MTDTQKNPMVVLTEQFISVNFPDEPYSIKPTGPEFAVHVGEDDKLKLSFRILGNTVYNVVIHQDYFNFISKLFCLHEYEPNSADVLHHFIECLNKNEAFRTVFQPIDTIDLSKHLTTSSQYEDCFVDVYDTDKKIKMITNTGNITRKGIAQFSFRFTKTNKLKCLPAIALFYGETAQFRIAVGFDLDNQTTHSITETVLMYEDFFIDNKLFDFDVEIDQFVNQFLDDYIIKFQKDNVEKTFYADNLSFNDKFEIFKMIAI